MKRLIAAAAAALTLALAGTAAAALVPGTFAQNSADAGCVKATVVNGTLHLEKNCPTSTVVSAFGQITGLQGQAFTSASFTLASTSQCQGGSPRFNIVSSNGTTYFLGCNNVTPVVNADGTATYTFNAATIAAGNNPSSFPQGTIQSASVLIDVQGTADISRVFVNGTLEQPVAAGGGHKHHKRPCPDGREHKHDCGKHKGDKHGDHDSQGQDNDDD